MASDPSPQKSWPRRHKFLTAIGVIIVLAIIGSVTSHSGGSSGGTSAKTSSSSSSSGGSSGSDQHATPNPAVRYDRSCDYELGPIGSAGFDHASFVAQVRLHNKGNVGAVVLVSAHWIQVGSADIKKSKTVHVAYEGSRVVNFKVHASQDMIDKIQSYEGATDCGIKATITDSYGSAH
jgi:hypothetical protein